MLVIHQVQVRCGKAMIEKNKDWMNRSDGRAINARDIISVQEPLEIVTELRYAFAFTIFSRDRLALEFFPQGIRIEPILGLGCKDAAFDFDEDKRGPLD